jgi:hypothetical protein
MAQLVRGNPLGERRSAALDQQLVSVPQDGSQHSKSEVVLVSASAGAGGKDGIVGGRMAGVVSMSKKRVTQKRHQVNLAQPRVGLRVLDPDTTVHQIDVTPQQPAELFGTKSGQDQRGDDRAAVGASKARIAVELRGRLEQGLEVDDRIRTGDRLDHN